MEQNAAKKNGPILAAVPAPGRWRGNDTFARDREHIASAISLIASLAGGEAGEANPTGVAVGALRALDHDLMILSDFVMYDGGKGGPLNAEIVAQHVRNIAERARATAEVVERLSMRDTIEPDPAYADQDPDRQRNTVAEVVQR